MANARVAGDSVTYCALLVGPFPSASLLVRNEASSRGWSGLYGQGIHNRPIALKLSNVRSIDSDALTQTDEWD